ncbi:MAG: hypothetical protein KatS3mg058_2455 [Roseiflexus sp.]|nr:MAG: hypothetical protein KatS3mg058_2455 [Roseiflexus sp.]
MGLPWHPVGRRVQSTGPLTPPPNESLRDQCSRSKQSRSSRIQRVHGRTAHMRTEGVHGVGMRRCALTPCPAPVRGERKPAPRAAVPQWACQGALSLRDRRSRSKQSRSSRIQRVHGRTAHMRTEGVHGVGMRRCALTPCPAPVRGERKPAPRAGPSPGGRARVRAGVWSALKLASGRA